MRTYCMFLEPLIFCYLPKKAIEDIVLYRKHTSECTEEKLIGIGTNT